MKTTSPDFLFGSIKNQISLSCLKNFSNILNNQDFNYHINRYLQKLEEQTLYIADGTSYAKDFPEVVNALQDIHLIVLSATDKINDNLTTLQFEFILPYGKLIFQANWTAYKDIRADELVDSLAVFKKHNLLKNVVYRDTNNALIKIPFSLEEILKTIFKLIDNDTIYTQEQYEKWAIKFGKIR